MADDLERDRLVGSQPPVGDVEEDVGIGHAVIAFVAVDGDAVELCSGRAPLEGDFDDVGAVIKPSVRLVVDGPQVQIGSKQLPRLHGFKAAVALPCVARLLRRRDFLPRVRPSQSAAKMSERAQKSHKSPPCELTFSGRIKNEPKGERFLPFVAVVAGCERATAARRAARQFLLAPAASDPRAARLCQNFPTPAAQAARRSRASPPSRCGLRAGRSLA